MALNELILQLKDLQSDEQIWMRPVVLALAGEVRHRIHVEGLRPDGSQIGTYQNSYMRERERNNRSSDKKMVYSLTRQMEQDFIPIAENNQYGLGFNNSHNFDKATWLEEKRPGVYDLSDHEVELAELALTDYINGLFG